MQGRGALHARRTFAAATRVRRVFKSHVVNIAAADEILLASGGARGDAPAKTSRAGMHVSQLGGMTIDDPKASLLHAAS